MLLGKLVYGDNNQLIAEMLGGYMAGVTVSGVLWAVFQNNAGGAWDNAKKSFEAGVMINGEMTYKGSDAHKAAVTGDTVGDPFKDTSGPSMNILIKLTCLIGLVIAPILGSGHSDTAATASCCAGGATTEMMCEAKKCDPAKMATMTKDECAAMCKENGCSEECTAKCLSMYDADGKFVGEKTQTIKLTTMKDVRVEMTNDNGKTKATVTTTTNGTTTTQTFEGTEEEVKAKIKALK